MSAAAEPKSDFGALLRQRLPDIGISTAAEEGFDVNALEAQAFAYLAVRRLYHLPATFPSTTGVAEPMVCGQVSETE